MTTNKKITILAIETSCDETAIAVLSCSGGFKNPRYEIRANVVASQIKLHAPFGGVVPNIAKREHKKNLPDVLIEALKSAKIKDPSQEIDVLAITVGPGLEPALWAGISFAQELAQDWKLPVVAVNHMEGHIAAVLLEQNRGNTKHQSTNSKRLGFGTWNLKFPAIALLVSGGHTELVVVRNWLDYKVIGETLDDAAGEAFDKVARMMNLGYPGGPVISRIARTGNRYAFSFPRPMIHLKNYDFSFSGLKTAVLYTLRDLKELKVPYTKNDIAASFEEAVVDVLIVKTLRAVEEYRARSVIVGGGVAANARLRERFSSTTKEARKTFALFLPASELTTDNAAIIAAAAYFHALKKDFTDWKKLAAHAMMPL